MLLLYQSQGNAAEWELRILPLGPVAPGAKRESRVFLRTQHNNVGGRFSPNGRWVAYLSDESGRYEVYVRPFPGPGGTTQISSGGGDFQRWRRDGRELFYLATGGQLMAAEIAERNGELVPGRVMKLFNVASLAYDVTADGQKFIVVENPGATEQKPLTLVQNWPALLRK